MLQRLYQSLFGSRELLHILVAQNMVIEQLLSELLQGVSTMNDVLKGKLEALAAEVTVVDQAVTTQITAAQQALAAAKAVNEAQAAQIVALQAEVANDPAVIAADQAKIDQLTAKATVSEAEFSTAVDAVAGTVQSIATKLAATTAPA